MVELDNWGGKDLESSRAEKSGEKRSSGLLGDTEDSPDGDRGWRTATPTPVATVNPAPKSPVLGPTTPGRRDGGGQHFPAVGLPHVPPHLSRCIFRFGARRKYGNGNEVRPGIVATPFARVRSPSLASFRDKQPRNVHRRDA